MDLPPRTEPQGWRGGLIILTAACIHPTPLGAIPACCIYGSTERLHGNLSGQGVAGKGCFYLLMRSLPVAQCLSTSVSAQPAAQLLKRGALSINACRGRPSSVISIQDGLRGCRVRRVTHISFCPVGKITNGSEIAVPQSGSSLLCSHANPQSAHKPRGWCWPPFHLECDSSVVCVPLCTVFMQSLTLFCLGSCKCFVPKSLNMMTNLSF